MDVVVLGEGRPSVTTRDVDTNPQMPGPISSLWAGLLCYNPLTW